MKKLLISCIAGAAALGVGAANAVTFQFKGDGGPGVYDSPTGNIAPDCGSIGQDICSDNDALGLTYSKSGIEFTAFGYANGVAAQLIQDVVPNNSGIGVLSEADQEQDQTQFDSLEIIEFVFNQVVTLLDIEFNAGNDTDCSVGGSEGPCGDFALWVDDLFVANFAAEDLVAAGGAQWTGTKFSFRPITAGAGFNIAQFTIQEIPVPGALLLLLTGLGGLGFASRKKRA